MKKFLFLLVLVCVSWQANAQKISENDFIGQWTSSESTVEMVIWKDTKGKFQVMVFDKSDGEVLEMNKFEVKKTHVDATMRTPSTEWVINMTIDVLDHDHLTEVIDNEAKTTVNWVRVK